LSSLISGELDVNRYVILERPASHVDGSCDVGGAQITLNEDSPTRMEISLSTPSDGWLVLADVWYPGWRATVDGEETTIRRADYLFRALPIPQGDHQVVMVYRPPLFLAGLILSLLAWVVIFILSFFLIRQARRAGG
jgi:uncharacterized membrane protein YfhO